MSTQETSVDSTHQEIEAAGRERQRIEDAERFKRIKILTPVRGFLNGASATLDGSFMIYFFTDVYRFPIAFTGFLSVASIVLSWIFSPIFAAFSDKFKFKNSKFWPWMVIGFTIKYACLMIVMVLPALGFENGSFLAPLAFVIVLVARLCDRVGHVPAAGMAPIITKLPSERQFLAQAQKIGHEAGKGVWGFAIPLILVAFTSLSGGDIARGFAITAVLLYVFGWFGPIIFALFGVRGSYIEREAIKQTERQRQTRIPISQTLKVLFTNRPVLGMFLFFMLHKVAFFTYVIYGISVFDHIFNQPELVGPFLTIFSFASIAGVLCGRLWTKIFKESKRSCAMAMVAHIIFTAVIAVTFNYVQITIFFVLFATSSFFMGMLETWVMPLYTACAEYGNWKTGVTMNALVMSTFALTIGTGIALPPILASAILRPETYNQDLIFMFTWVPLILGIASLLSLIFIFNLNDVKIKKIQDDLAEGKVQATSDLKV